MDAEADSVYADFVSARWHALLRTALSLGCTLPEAEDLVQTTLVRCYVQWRKVASAEHRDAYVARMLINAHRDTHRSRWRRERPVEDVPDTVAPDPTTDLGAVDAIRRAVASLSQGQREVVALRYFVRLTEADIAEVLAIAPGTVKSRLSRALDLLSRDAHVLSLRPEEGP